MGPEEFFSALYGDAVGEEDCLVLFTGRKPKWTCRWHNDIESAADEVNVLTQGDAVEIYFGVALQDRATARGSGKGLEQTRGTAATSIGIPGLWLDLDWNDEAHKKTRYPPTKASCLALVEKLPALPTLMLDTGRGLHLYWLFQEFWRFKDDADRLRAANLSAGWQACIQDIALREGQWKIDSTFDLPRVLRIPGTVNQKYGTTVTVEATRDVTYEPDTFEQWIPDETFVTSVEGSAVLKSDTALVAAAEPPVSKMMLLMELDADFEKTWTRRRKDLKSQSELDLALLTFAAKAGWDEQELVDLGVAFRRHHGEDLKLRDTYWGPTVAKAVAANKHSEASEWLQEHAATPMPKGDAEAESARQGRLRALSAVLKGDQAVAFRIRSILKFEGEPPGYRMLVVLSDRTADIPLPLGAKTFTVHAKLVEALVEGCELILPYMKPAAWRPHIQPLLDCIEVVSVGPSDTVASQILSWLQLYVQDNVVHPNADEGFEGRGVFLDPLGRTLLKLSGFQTWLNLRGERYSERRLGMEMRVAGCENVQINYRRKDRDGAEVQANQRAWVLPFRSVASKHLTPETNAK